MRNEALAAYFEQTRKDIMGDRPGVTMDEAVARVSAIRDGGSLQPKDIRARAKRIGSKRD